MDSANAQNLSEFKTAVMVCNFKLVCTMFVCLLRELKNSNSVGKVKLLADVSSKKNHEFIIICLSPLETL